jgi:integrase
VVFAAVRTGLRRGELMALRWEDIHLGEAQPTLRVQRSVRKEADGSLRVKEPKGGRARTVPICSDLAGALGERRPARVRAGALVFPGPVEGFLDHERLWRVLAGAAKDAGLNKHVHRTCSPYPTLSPPGPTREWPPGGHSLAHNPDPRSRPRPPA